MIPLLCPPSRKESETPVIFTVFYSYILNFCSYIIIAIICLFIPINTKSISQPTERVFAPNQQRCSRVLNPLALLFTLASLKRQVPLCYGCCHTDS